MRSSSPRKATVVVVLLAATLAGGKAGSEEQASSPAGDVVPLPAYTASLLQQIEELRAEMARLARERDELAEQLVAARGALESFRDGERRRLAKKTELERSNSSSELGPEAAPTHGANAALPDVAGGGAVDRRAESQRRIERLEGELRELREREQATQANAKSLEKALDTEKRAGQSKLEALQSVLQNSRSAGSQLREELDETRRQNAELTHQVSVLHARRDDSTPAGDQALPPRAQEVASAEAPETTPAPVPRPPSVKPKRRPSSIQPSKLDSPATRQPTPDVTEDPAAASDLREQLSVERERRATLEEEVKRLTSTGSSDEKFTEVWNALQSARSEILVLSNQLAEERKSREDLEIALTRTQLEPGAQPDTDLTKRLAQTLTDRRSEADRLAAQLKEANEVIVRLKGRLEASGSPEAEGKMLTELQKDNETLRSALKAAEEANDALREKADMAQRLAEMVYGKGP